MMTLPLLPKPQKSSEMTYGALLWGISRLTFIHKDQGVKAEVALEINLKILQIKEHQLR